MAVPHHAQPGPLSSWLLAARPATLWAAVSPVLVGSSLAAADGAFSATTFLVILAAAVAIQVGVNFANDVADAARGADNENRIGPTRAVSAGLITPRRMWVGVAVAFGIATIAGAYLIWLAGPWILFIGVASLLAALGYTNGPMPYGYVGLGEASVFVFFGLAATVGTRFVYDQSAPADAWMSGVAMGLLAVAILVANNLRDLDTDRAAGKRTLAVRVGADTTRLVYTGCIAGAFVVIVLASLGGILPVTALIALVAVPFALPLVRSVLSNSEGGALIGVLKGTARLQVTTAALLSLGVLI